MGKLELIIGPMFASKSTELISAVNRYMSIGMSVLVINNHLNKRYGSEKISTHDNRIFDGCYNLKNLADIFELKEYNDVDVIVIEELQFFPDAFDIITFIVDNTNKIIIAAGLIGDSNRNPFGDVLRLIPHAEKIKHLTAFCKRCNNGTLAQFTKRLTDDKEKIIIGTSDLYIAVCRKHFLENN
jgi:thymidine kinase